MSEFAGEEAAVADEDVAAPISPDQDDPAPSAAATDDTEDSWDD